MQPPAIDPEGLLLELAVARAVIDRATAEALRARRHEASVPTLLVRLAHVPEPVLARLKAEVTAYLQRGYGGNAASGSRPTVPPGPQAAPPQTAPPYSPPVGEAPRARLAPHGPSSAPSSSSSGSREVKRPQVGDRFGRYLLVAELGRGGMGIVFRAKHEDLGREVALKMLLEAASSNDAAVRRFYAEARSVAKLSHPHIVTVHDVGAHEGVHYFTMDYVEGRGLQELVAKGELTKEKTLSLAIKLTRALAYAHGEGVIHRDLKPANVLIDKKGEPRITDFGIAKDLTATQATQAGEFLGTPAYMPPEQAKGRALDADARADVYSLGAVLFEMVCGRPPFVAHNAFETMKLVVSEPPPRPRSLKPEISPDLEAIILKCLEKLPDDRYPSAEELATDLDKFVQSESVEAPRAPAIASSDLKRALVGALVGLAFLGIVGGGIAGWAVHVNRLAKEEAERVAREEKAAEAARVAAKAHEEEERKTRAKEKGKALVHDALEAANRDDPKAALSLAVDATAAAPDLALAHETLARLYLDLRKDSERALPEAEKALALEPSSLAARAQHARALVMLGKEADASADAERLDQLGSEGEGWAARVRGELALERKDYATAIPALSKAAEVQTRDVAVQLLLARACLEAHRFADAERVASEACALDPTKAPGFLLRAKARAGANKAALALEDAKLARTLAPDDNEARALVTKLESASKDSHTDPSHKALHQAATAALQGLAHGDRHLADEYLQRPREPGECLQLLVERSNMLGAVGRLPEAEVELSRAHDMDPANLGIIASRGMLRKQLERYDEALADLEASLAGGCPPQLVPVAVAQAQVLDHLGRAALAQTAWERAIAAAVEPRIKAHVHHERAHQEIAHELYVDAEKDLDVAIRLDPTQGHYPELRGEARFKRGDVAAAVIDWKAALEKTLSPEQAAHVRANLAAAESSGKRAPP